MPSDPDLTVRRANYSDVDRVDELYVEMVRGYSYHPSSPDDPGGLRYEKSDWALYCNHPSTIFLVAESEKTVVGFLLAYICVNWCYADVGYVSPAARTNGAGASLLQQLTELCGARALRLTAVCLNPADEQTVSFLRKRGFWPRETSLWLTRKG